MDLSWSRLKTHSIRQEIPLDKKVESKKGGIKEIEILRFST